MLTYFVIGFHEISKKIIFEVVNLIKKRIVHHANDVTNVYFTNAIPAILHKYFHLPGKFARNYTTRIVKRDGSEGEMDWLMLVEPDNCRLFERILINVEFQSSYVTKEKIKIVSEYKDYAKTYYGLPVLTVIIITDGYESSEIEYSRVSSDILKPIYIHMEWDEIIERLKNIEEKIDNQEQLDEDEGLDFVFLSMFAPKKEAKGITEKLVHLFNEDTSLKRPFRDHVGYGLSIMIKKYFGPSSKAEELLKMLEEIVDNPKLRIVAEFEEDYARQVYERKLAESESKLSESELKLAESELKLSESESKLADNELKLAEKDKAIAENKTILAKKDDEIKVLRKILKDNGISY